VKTLGVLLASVSAPLRRWNVRVLFWLVVGLVLMVVTYAAIFHHLMALEGRDFSWPTSFYWVLTVMSTLGFGDITFETDLGRTFSMVVLVTGVASILVLLPFVFIQFVFTPWMQAREAARAPKRVDDEVHGHLVLTELDVVTDALIERATQAKVPYVVLVPDLDEALRLHDHGYEVMRGPIDDLETYRRARVEHAALVATTRADTTNTNIAFTVRELSKSVPIVATANSAASVDILQLAGCDEVIQLGDLLGRAMARRVLGGDHRSHTVGDFGHLRIAEASVLGTELSGAKLRDLDLRRRCGVNVVGVWQRGEFERAGPDTELCDQSVIILAGTDEQLRSYDEVHGAEHPSEQPVLILGGGRVGRAAARNLRERGLEATIVEKLPERIRPEFHYVQGDAAELEVLEEAGLDDASTVLVTTHEDDVNVYLTLYCRRLREDLHIISRATLDRNVSTLHRAGADAVLSYASIGATALWNAVADDRRLVIAEGLEVFQVPVPASLAGRTLAETDLGASTGVNVVALACDGHFESNPDPTAPLPEDADLVVIGDEEAEDRFLDRYPAERR
jgi:voltage-gated potassium channel